MRRELGMTIALVVMCLGLYISNPDFLGQSNSINTLRQISMLGIFAIGIGFVIIAGGIDLSIGSVIGLTGVLIAKLSSTQLGGLGYPLWIGIPVALGVALLFGLGQGLLITRLKLQPFIVTLGGMLFLRGVSQTIAGGGTLSLGGSPLLTLANGGLLKSGSDALVPYPLLMFLAVSGVAAYALHFTVFGRYVYAIGGNRDAAEYSGINVKRVETSTYVISAGLGGVAGVCYASYIGQMSQQVGIAYEMYAIAAAVLGGCSLRGGEGTVLGIIIGSAVMRVIDNGINMFQLPYEDADRIQRIWRLDPNWTFIIIGAVILVAVILDQIVHIVQTKRRIRHASAGAAEAAPSLQAAVAVSAAEPPAARAPDRESV
ncbi:ABC transporter permease [Sorangium sp. So ce1504]|uniref:ABC transporter permease n=1 Tax=Sorangium sp. So ce1504 TaxID=3133337 RepID=UPI003F60D73D